MTTIRPRAISLFTGAGGLDYGLEAAGFETLVAVEQDQTCTKSLAASRGWPIVNLDIADVSASLLLDLVCSRVSEIDVVVGGPPCQPFSRAANWVNGHPRGFEDSRAGTIQEFMRIVEGVLPRVMILENVEGFASGGSDGALGFIQSRFEDINSRHGTAYTPHTAVLNAADYGVPQKRRRLFVIAPRNGYEFTFPAPTHSNDSDSGLARYLTAWDALHDVEAECPEELAPKGRWAELLPSIPEGCNYLWHSERQGGLPLFGWRTRYWSFLLKLAKDRPAWTIPATPSQNSGPFHWDNRLLSTSELLRLQTFPENATICGDRAMRQCQLGNAVPSLLAEVVGLEVRQQLLDARPLHKRSLRLALSPTNQTPPPEAPASVPAKYLARVGRHAAHPGPGRGPRAVSRRAREEANEQAKQQIAAA